MQESVGDREEQHRRHDLPGRLPALGQRATGRGGGEPEQDDGHSDERHRLGAEKSRSMAALEIGGADLRVGQQFAAAAGQHDLPGLHHIAAMRQPQCVVGVLLDQQDRGLLRLR